MLVVVAMMMVMVLMRRRRSRVWLLYESRHYYLGQTESIHTQRETVSRRCMNLSSASCTRS